jgi:hypothetical protein
VSKEVADESSIDGFDVPPFLERFVECTFVRYRP